MTIRHGQMRNIGFSFEDDGNQSSSHTMVDELPIREELWRPKKGDIVFDVGACYGSYALPAAAVGADVYAFEPFPELIAALQRNANVNSFKRFHVMPYGLGIKEETLTLDIYAPSPPATVPIRRLDDVFAELALPRLDWLKCDTEGMEMAVVVGGRNTLLAYHPKLLLEIHSFKPGIRLDEIIEYVRELEYREIKTRPWGGCQMVYAGMLS